MTTEKILDLLEPKNQNLPNINIGYDFKKADIIYVPVVEKEEKNLHKIFPFIKKEKTSGKKGEGKWMIHDNREYNFVGVGPAKDITYRAMRHFYGSSYLSAASRKPKKIAIYCPDEWLEAAAVGVGVAGLKADILKPKPKKNHAPDVEFVNSDFKAKAAYSKEVMKKGLKTAYGKNIMRILGALPPNELTPPKYAEVIMALAKKWRVKCERIHQKDLEKYNLLRAVSLGSAHDSELLIATIHPKNGETKKSVAVFGKGLCYDSGGLQGKQDRMKDMKMDMEGSASLLGTIFNISQGGLDIKETTYFLLPLAENMMGSKAMRADDVYIAGDGQAVEIMHTDAEGRLILADSICYVKNNFKNVHRFYTIATLTGSCLMALGQQYTGVICNNKDLALEAEKIGKEVGDHAHAGPWDMDYDDNNSPVADVGSIGETPREAGWIKAGLFLYRFVPKAKKGNEQIDFCHFDIAGSIDIEAKGKAWRGKGFSSGVGVGLLSKLLTN